MLQNSGHRIRENQGRFARRLMAPIIADVSLELPVTRGQVAFDEATNKLAFSPTDSTWNTLAPSSEDPALAGTWNLANVTVSADGVITAVENGGPAVSPPDNALVRYDASQAPEVHVKSSGTTLDDAGVLTGVTGIDTDGATFTLTTPLFIDDAANTIITGDLLVQGTTITTDVATIMSTGYFITLGAGNTVPATPREGGIILNYEPSALLTNIDVGGIVAGVAAVSNPIINTVDAAVFVAGDIVQVVNAANTDNNAFYEVDSHVGTVLTLRGVGTIPTTVDFVSDQVITDATVQGLVQKTTLIVLISDNNILPGHWQNVTVSNTTGITYNDFVDYVDDAGGGLSLIDAGSQGTQRIVLLRTLAAGTGISLSELGGLITIENTDLGSDVTLINAGVGETLVNDSVGPELKTKALVAGTGIALSSNLTDVTITNDDRGSDVTLSNAGVAVGHETLVNDGVGPFLAVKAIVSGGTGIALSSNGTDITITNDDRGSDVSLSHAGVAAGSQSLVNDGVGPLLAVKGIVGGGTGVTVSSNSTDVTVTLNTPVVLANGGTNASLVAVNGGSVYSTATALAITAAGTSGQVLTSNGAAAPTWQTVVTASTALASSESTGFPPATIQSTAGAGVTAITTLSVVVPATGTYFVLANIVCDISNQGASFTIERNAVKIAGTDRRNAVGGSTCMNIATIVALTAADTIQATMQRGGAINIDFVGGDLSIVRLSI